jgi:hypothetical protein
MEWMPIETAPKGGGALSRKDPNWVEPPNILLFFPDNEDICIGYWDWYYAEGGYGYNGDSAWIDYLSGEQLALYYDNPSHWMPLPLPPKEKE